MADLNAAYAHCEMMVKNHYENFPVGSFLIPKEKRKYIWAVYAYARTADDFADEGRHPRESQESLQKRLDALDDWQAKLIQCTRGVAEHPIFIALADTVKAKEIPVQLLKDLLTAYRMDVKQKRYENIDEVYYYCRHSANPVGRLVLHIFGYKEESIHLLSDKICTALQLANFWQDIWVDLQKDRIYLPQDEMKRFGVTEGDLHAKICNRAFQLLLHSVINRTKELFNEGLPLCEKVRNDLKLEMRMTWLGGTSILKKIEQDKFDIYRHRPEIRLIDKVFLLGRSLVPAALGPMK